MAGSVHDDGAAPVRTLTLRHAGKRNALDATMIAELRTALAGLSGEVRAVLLRGDGDAFCAGYDLTAFPPTGAAGPLPDEAFRQLVSELIDCPKPIVALVTGPAFGGGCDLAAACDFRVGTPKAVFCMPPSRLGIVYAPEGLWRFVALLGLSRAKRMFLTGCRVDAKRALQWGLLDEVAPAREALKVAQALCDELAQGSTTAISGMKRGFRLLERPPLTPDELIDYEALRRSAFAGPDAREAREAFIAKRRPSFEPRR